ncbi:MAG: hypothetical protein WC770_03180 [Phycisphaerae bacterium]|jgi:beta-1,4-mannosyl-glycoprotein beta-1,4-N-acetylglucosaminyltransferase
MIYDCFTFFNELLLLEIRLNTLDAVVDKFVLVESPYTHTGKEKPLYFEQAKNRPEFAKFKDKIIHIIVEDMPLKNHWRNENKQELLAREQNSMDGKPTTGVWQNENYQRKCIKRGLANLQPDDIVIVGDADEIANPDVFPIIRTKQKPCILRQKDYYYYLNLRSQRDNLHPAFCRGRDFIDGQLVRSPKTAIEREIIDNAGWHFGYLMTPDNIAAKINSLACVKYDTDFFTDKNRIAKCIKAKRDLYGRKKMKFYIEPLDVPKYIKENIEKFRPYIAQEDESSSGFFSFIKNIFCKGSSNL